MHIQHAYSSISMVCSVKSHVNQHNIVPLELAGAKLPLYKVDGSLAPCNSKGTICKLKIFFPNILSKSVQDTFKIATNKTEGRHFMNTTKTTLKTRLP